MRLSRSNRAALVLMFVAVLGSFGPALDGSGQGGLQVPAMDTWLDFANQTFRINAWGGAPGSVGALDFIVVQGPLPGVVQLPFTFDASGEAMLVVPLAVLNNGFDLAVGIQLIAEGSDGITYTSPVWALTARNYIVTDPEVAPCGSCPTTPGGWVDFVTWPGTTTGTLYPHTTVAIFSSEERQFGQPMLALESGPAGSFPIN